MVRPDSPRFGRSKIGFDEILAEIGTIDPILNTGHISKVSAEEVYRVTKRVWWPQGKRWVKLRLSTKAIKTLEHKGLDAMAKEAGIDLRKY